MWNKPGEIGSTNDGKAFTEEIVKGLKLLSSPFISQQVNPMF